jgi:hypothetical protein
MLDDADNMLPHVRFAAEEQQKYRDSVGIIAPFELICLPCSSQGVRIVIPPGATCPRCLIALRADQSRGAAVVRAVFPSARPEREPIGCWCLGGLGGESVRVYGSPPSWLHQSVRRWLFGDVYREDV